jgi:hypothetical protein
MEAKEYLRVHQQFNVWRLLLSPPISGSNYQGQIVIHEHPDIFYNGIVDGELLHQFADTFADAYDNDAYYTHGNQQARRARQLERLGIIVKYTASNYCTKDNELDHASDKAM